MPLSFSPEQAGLTGRQAQEVPLQNSSRVDQQTPSLVDGRRVDREVPFYPVPTLPESPFQFPHTHDRPISGPIRPDGSTSPQRDRLPRTTRGARGHSIIPARAWILPVPCFFLSFFFSVRSTEGKSRCTRGSWCHTATSIPLYAHTMHAVVRNPLLSRPCASACL